MSVSESICFLPTTLYAAADYLRVRCGDYKRSAAGGESAQTLNKELQLSAHLSLVLTTWRLDANLSFNDVEKSGALKIWSLIKYWISFYDDVIDAQPSVQLSRCKIKHAVGKNGLRASQITEILLGSLGTLNLPIEKKKQIYKLLGDFRRYQYDVYQLQCSVLTVSSGDESYTEHKLNSSGDVMRLMVSIMHIIMDVDCEIAKNLEETYYHYGRAGQIVDDIADLNKDGSSGLNVVWRVMQGFSSENELASKLKYSPVSILFLKNTRTAINQKFADEVSQINPKHSNTLNSLHFFRHLVLLYALFETKQLV